MNIVPLPPANNPTPLFFPGSVPGETRRRGKSTRNVEAFLKKTAIAYHPNSRKSTKFWQYAIAVFFKKGFDIASVPPADAQFLRVVCHEICHISDDIPTQKKKGRSAR